jgi:hypothetical protein
MTVVRAGPVPEMATKTRFRNFAFTYPTTELEVQIAEDSSRGLCCRKTIIPNFGMAVKFCPARRKQKFGRNC